MNWSGRIRRAFIWNNIKTTHHRWMMRYLQKRGWVVFYLEPQYRECNDVCWLRLSESCSRKVQ